MCQYTRMLAARAQGLRILAGVIRLVCGARPMDISALPRGPKVFYANHTSHLDFTVIWAVLPQRERLQTRPVAGRDYWVRNKLTRFVGCRVFDSVLVERQQVTRTNNPLEQMLAVLGEGKSLIVFPEGTRGLDALPADFKGGLFHLSLRSPQTPLIPVYLENLNRMMPKGAFLPIPLISRITIGRPLGFRARKGEKEPFLASARQALIDLADLSHHE